MICRPRAGSGSRLPSPGNRGKAEGPGGVGRWWGEMVGGARCMGDYPMHLTLTRVARPQALTIISCTPSAKPLREDSDPTAGSWKLDTCQELLLGHLSEPPVCVQTDEGHRARGLLPVWGSVLYFLTAAGGGVRTQGMSHLQIRIPPTPTLQVETMELSFPGSCQCLLLNPGAKGPLGGRPGGGSGQRSASDSGPGC